MGRGICVGRCLLPVLLIAGLAQCREPASPDAAVQRALLLAGGMSRMSGSGAIGSRDKTFYGVDVQSFVLDAGESMGVPYGQFDYIDSGFVKEDGNYPHFVVGPEWPGTGVFAFAQTSAMCADIAGVGHLINTGELLAFQLRTCDNGTPGVGLDEFGIQVPQRLITHGGVYFAGPAVLFRGELTSTGSPSPLF